MPTDDPLVALVTGDIFWLILAYPIAALYGGIPSWYLTFGAVLGAGTLTFLIDLF